MDEGYQAPWGDCEECGLCEDCREAEEAEEAGPAAAITLRGLIGDPGTLSAFLLHLLDDLQYTPWDVIDAVQQPHHHEARFAAWQAERLRLARVRLEEQLETARKLLEGGGAR